MAPLNITKGVIDEIRSKLDIVDVVSEKVLLKKAGSNYKGLCPFHKEKTSSFVVSPDKQIFRCFGCNEGGDVISFVQRTDGLTFYEAIVKLAEMAGVSIPFSEKDDKDYSLRQSRRQEFLNINILAKDHYMTLISDKNSDIYKYISARGIKEDILREFNIGYAGNAWDGLYVSLVNKGVSMAKASELGLLKEKSGKYYDTFRDRLMFPIQNHSGEVVAFGGRIIKDSPEAPKYLNSKDSEIYTKGDVLYGLNKTKSFIRESSYVVVVEGYMDFISLYQAGIKNIVATLGTAFTDKQAQLIKRYTDRVVLFYDSDEAGIKAAKRSLPMLLEKGLKTDALFLEGGLDPDEAIKEYGFDKLSKMLLEAGPLLGTILSDKFSRDKSVDDISNSTSDVLGYIGLIPDPVTRLLWIKELSFRSGMSTKELSGLMKRYIKNDLSSKDKKNSVQIKRTSKVNPLYKRLITVFFAEPALAQRVFDDEWSMYIPNDFMDIIHDVKSSCTENKTIDVSSWIEISRRTNAAWIEDLLTKGLIDKKSSFDDPEKEFNGCMVRFKVDHLEQTKGDLLKRIKEGEDTENTLREYEAIIKEIKRLKPMLGVMTKGIEEHA